MVKLICLLNSQSAIAENKTLGAVFFMCCTHPRERECKTLNLMAFFSPFHAFICRPPHSREREQPKSPKSISRISLPASHVKLLQATHMTSRASLPFIDVYLNWKISLHIKNQQRMFIDDCVGCCCWRR